VRFTHHQSRLPTGPEARPTRLFLVPRLSLGTQLVQSLAWPKPVP